MHFDDIIFKYIDLSSVLFSIGFLQCLDQVSNILAEASAHHRTMNSASLLGFLIIVSHYSRVLSGSTVYVKPLDCEVQCPDDPCLTLGDYITQQDTYFISNTTFLFLPGIHNIEIKVRLEYVSNLTFQGSMNPFMSTLSSRPQIIFSPLANITWVDGENINIAHLTFILSGITDPKVFFSTLFFSRCRNIHLSGVEFVYR